MPAGVKKDSLFRTFEGEVGGTTYTFREAAVKDNDAAVTAAKQADGTYDGRLMMRLLVIKCSVDPKMNDEALSELPQRVYLQLCDIVNDLNAVEEYDPDTTEGNP